MNNEKCDRVEELLEEGKVLVGMIGEAMCKSRLLINRAERDDSIEDYDIDNESSRLRQIEEDMATYSCRLDEISEELDVLVPDIP